VNPLSALYGAAARRRRAWYAARPGRRVRLGRPVVSIGNLVVGGSGKTPLVIHVAALLRGMGERPAILSRGYGRRRPPREVTIAGDGHGTYAAVGAAGDEPRMIADALPDVPVVVGADRARTAQVACDRFDCTVLVLDDGFQHVRVERDVDLLVVAPGDLTERVLPVGRLREPIDAARHADAVVVPGTTDEAWTVALALGVREAFTLVTGQDEVRPIDGEAAHARRPGRALAVAGIARPRRFFDALRGSGWTVAREVTYRDHHWFSKRDVERLERMAASLEVDAIVTTAKDAVRLRAVPGWPAAYGTRPWAVLPVRVRVTPEDAFAVWLRSRLAAARS
jgi:tetraacyldisaccharide 4'-kinase